MINELDLKILKSICLDTNFGLEFAYTYEENLFRGESAIFARIVISYIKAYRALPTKRVLLLSHKENDEYTDVISEYWDALDEEEYDMKEYPFDLKRLKKRFDGWCLADIRQMNAESTDNSDKMLKKIALKLQDVQAVKAGRTFKQRTVKKHLAQFGEQYIAKAKGEAESEAVLTHFSGLDMVTDGLKGSEMLIIGGETNAGKSILLNNFGRSMWQQGNDIFGNPDSFRKGNNVMYFSLEMPYEECFARWIGSLADVDQRAIMNGTLDERERKRIDQAKKFIEAYPYEYDIIDFPRGLSVNELEMRYNDALLEYKPDVVVIDYLQLMSDPARAKEADWLKLGGIAGDVHEFGRARDVVTVTAVQLTDLARKGGNDEHKRVGLHRLGRSSLIAHHANVIIQIETRQDEAQYPDLKYHVIKNRKGPLLKNGMMRKSFANGLVTDILYTEDSENEQMDVSLSAKLAEVHCKDSNE